MRICENGKYRDLTENEIEKLNQTELEQSEIIPELTTDEIVEILAEQDYRICLLELGVDKNDL